MANEKCLEILSSAPRYHIGEDKAKEIDKLVHMAQKERADLKGALE
ncbi:MAG: hypothetical protein ACYCXK_05755 [Candidatus Humimicrobiaceae bacterium]